MFELRDVTLRRAGELVLHDVSTALPVGASCVAGPSGCGKSTMLRLLNRLADPEKRADVIPLWKSMFYVDPNNWIGEGFGTRYHGQRTLSFYSNPQFDALLARHFAATHQAVIGPIDLGVRS